MTSEMVTTTSVVDSILTSHLAIGLCLQKSLSSNTTRNALTSNNQSVMNLRPREFLVDSKLYDIPILHVSPSWIQQEGLTKHKRLQECSLNELMFITAFNSLNNISPSQGAHVQQIQYSSSLDDKTIHLRRPV